MTFSDYRDRLFLALAVAAESKPQAYVNAEVAAQAATLDDPKGFLRDAVRNLEQRGYVRAAHTIAGSHVQLTGEGWDEVERLKQKVQPTASNVPASDRYVTINHNSPEYAEAVTAIDQTLEA